MIWSFDISQAPRGKNVTTVHQRPKGDFAVTKFVPDSVILATKCRKVLKSHWLPDEERWVMLAKGEEPVAWMAWPEFPNNTPHTTTVAP